MADETAPSRSRPRQTGLIGSLVALASALADFFESRAALLASESKAALIQFLVAAVCLVAAVLFFAFGYIFLTGERGGRSCAHGECFVAVGGVGSGGASLCYRARVFARCWNRN